MEQEISLLDLLAAAVRKGKQIIAFAVIAGLLFMGYSYLGARSAKGGDEETYAMADAERQLRDLQKTVERSERASTPSASTSATACTCSSTRMASAIRALTIS